MATKIVNFMTPWHGVLVTGHGHIVHIVQNALYFFTKNLFFTPGQRQNKVLQCLNSKYENSKFQDPWGRGSPGMVWPY